MNLSQVTQHCHGHHTTGVGAFPRRQQHLLQAKVHIKERPRVDVRSASPETQDSQTAPPPAVSQNGSAPASKGSAEESRLTFKPPTGADKFWTSWNLLRARPWRRFKKGSVLVLKIGGEIGDKKAGPFSDTYSLGQICTALSNAAKDPRISGVFVTITPLAIGWAKVQELRRYVDLFRQSGKLAISYMWTGGEKEHYLATAFSEFYAAPSASFALRGFAVSGSFVAGVFEKAGIEPQVKRLGKYKSAGDQLSRKDMSEAQKEQLTALLDDIYAAYKSEVGAAVWKTEQEVEAMLDAGYVDIKDYAKGGWLTGLKYEDEIVKDLEQRTDSKPDKLKKVTMKKYAKLSSATFHGFVGGKRIAVIRASGAISGAEGGGPTSSGINASLVIKQVRKCVADKSVAAVVLRVDSPGGEATASDLMWREIGQLAAKKPVVASMGDVAASGGYYMAMAAQSIVAERLTITGSVGVVTAKFNLEELYRRIGFAKETISRGRFAEILQENRGFTEEEEALFDAGANSAYREFRNKAAESRGMTPDQMEEFAQGRVWSGSRALEIGLVDSLGGLQTAITAAKKLAKLDPEKPVRVSELMASSQSPLALLSGASAAAGSVFQTVQLLGACGLLMSDNSSPEEVGRLVLAAAARANGGNVSRRPQVMAVMDDLKVVGSSEL